MDGTSTAYAPARADDHRVHTHQPHQGGAPRVVGCSSCAASWTNPGHRPGCPRRES